MFILSRRKGKNQEARMIGEMNNNNKIPKENTGEAKTKKQRRQFILAMW